MPGASGPSRSALGKLNNVREASKIARECRTILAAAGITLDYPVMRQSTSWSSARL
jgi:glutaryl-CoA dehydrogenase